MKNDCYRSNATAADLKAQVFALTGVPAERQKLLSKKEAGKDPQRYAEHEEDQACRADTARQMGAVEPRCSAGAEEKIVFMEDMSGQNSTGGTGGAVRAQQPGPPAT